MRLKFDELFTVQTDAVTPKVPIRINGMVMGPGVNFGKGDSFGGVDIINCIGQYLEVEIQRGVYIIRGFYS